MAIHIPVNLNTMPMTKRLMKSPIYIKTATIKAVQLTADGLRNGRYADLDVHRAENGGFVVDVYVMSEVSGQRSAILEASQPVRAGDWIITKPIQRLGDRESHCCKSNQAFCERYEATSETDIYRDISLLRVTKNPTGTHIEVTACWGTQQYGDAECYICTPVNRKDLEDPGLDQRYLLSANDFDAAYAPVEDVLGADWRAKL